MPESTFRCASLVVAVLVSLACVLPAAAEKRVALVIGNSAYTEAGRLPNAPNDAREVAAALGRLGFDVTLASDLKSEDFGPTVQDFVTKAQGAEVALFFYAGHALQLGQTNYLMPVDARLADELSVKRETVAAQDIVDLMESAARVNLVFLDACRNNPLAERLRSRLASAGRSASIGRGLGRIETKGRDTLIVFSAEAGAEALDTAGGSHSPFAAGLLAHMETPGLEIEVMLKDVTKSVRDATGGKQQPERLSRLESKFYFKEAGAPPAAVSSAGPSASDAELARLKAEIEALKRKQSEQQQANLAPPPKPEPAVRPEPAEPVPAAPAPAKPEASTDMKPGTVFRDCSECPEMVVVPAGSFTMGSPANEDGRSDDEGPQRKVTIGKPFAVGKLEVTRDAFEAFVKATGHTTGDGWSSFQGCVGKGKAGSLRKPDYDQTGGHPAVCVSWDDAKAYAEWLSKTTGKSYRLLTEAEWEYATRGVTEAGQHPRYHFGNDAKDLCGYANGADLTAKTKFKDRSVADCKDGHVFTAPAGSFKPNAFGVHDLHGNVWEWVEDCWQNGYQVAPSDGTARTLRDCHRRVVRGGSWSDDPWSLRAAFRHGFTADFASNFVGLRVARSLD